MLLLGGGEAAGLWDCGLNCFYSHHGERRLRQRLRNRCWCCCSIKEFLKIKVTIDGVPDQQQQLAKMMLDVDESCSQRDDSSRWSTTRGHCSSPKVNALVDLKAKAVAALTKPDDDGGD